MEEVRERGWLAADFFTHSYRISGHLDVRRKSLYDIINDSTTNFLELEDAYISPIHRPGDIIATHPASYLAKKNLTAVVVPHRDDALSRKHSYGSYFGTFLVKVFLTIPAFEIVGYLRLSTKMDIRHVLTSGTDEFMAVLDGRVRASIRPDVVFTGGGILVNKHHVGAFSTEKES
jgi:hypothetical protein